MQIDPRIHLRTRFYCLGIIFWVGFAALVYQMYSVRVLFMFFVENTHAVATAVSSFLAGLACSSLLFSRLTHHNMRNQSIVCWMMLAAAAYGYLVLGNYQWIPQLLDAIRRWIATAWLAATLKYAVMWIYLFLPAFFLGGAFPLINGLYLHSLDDSAQETGIVYFWDTLGAIIGALVAGFVLLPVLGLHATVTIAATINVLIAITLMPSRRYAYSASVCLFVVAAIETAAYSVNHDPRFRITQAGDILPENRDLDRLFGKVLFQQESPYGRVTVGTANRSKMLFINYRGMCERAGDTEKEFARAILPRLAARSEVLTIGLGCGFTAAELAFAPRTRRLDIVEINPVVPQAARFFAKENREVLDAPNISLHIVDGAEWLRNAPRQYDAILIDIEQVAVIYSSALFTREYFEIARGRLKEGGIFGFWSLTVSPEFTRVMVNTLRSVFPCVTWRTYGHATTYYASTRPFVLKPAALKETKGFTQKVMALSNAEINTLENPALEKYYNLNKSLGLPDDYSEGFVRR
jgi:spermidine synthase